MADSEIENRECLKLCKEYFIGVSNFYASQYISKTATGNRLDNIVPSWFFEHFSKDEEFRSFFNQSIAIRDEVKLLDENSDHLKQDLQRLSYLDLYCTYELAARVIDWINSEEPAIIEGKYRPRSHIDLRNKAWDRNEVTRPLGNIFGWSHKGFPTLNELLSASYETLVDNRQFAGFHLQEEITPLPHYQEA